MQVPSKIILYGANGYSAQLIIKELLTRDIKLILAGRNAFALKKLSENYNLPLQIFSLSNYAEVKDNLKNAHTLLNCAGPFSETAEILMDACLETKTNYLDITGEIKVLKAAWDRNEKAKQNGIVILSGIGFDTVPTDCISKKLKEEMPDAVSLKLAIASKESKISRGTLITMINQFGEKSIVRENGDLIPIELGSRTRITNFGEFLKNTVAVQWADVFNAFYSTGIPNIEVYLSLPEVIIKLLKNSTLFRKLVGLKITKQILIKYVSRNITGPDEKQRNKSRIFIWGQVENTKGEKIEHVYEFPDGYSLTAKSAAEVIIRILNNEVKPGTQTPSLAFGSSFMDQFVTRKIK